MAELAQVRKDFPELAGRSDDELVDAVHAAFYSDMPRGEVAKAFGLKEKEKPVPDRGVGGTLKDAGVSLMRGGVGAVQGVVGLADLASGGKAGKALEDVGVDLKGADEYWADKYTPAQKAANRALEDAGQPVEGEADPGFMTKAGRIAGAVARNPSVVPHAILQSVPSMALGGGAGMGAARAVPALRNVAGAIGEGLMSAGSTAEQIRAESKDKLLSADQTALAAGSGALTGALGAVSGRIARRMGFQDADSLFAGVRNDTTKQQSFTKQVLGAAVTEGFIEELPQGVQEQIAQNLALGKPLDEGVPMAAVMGPITGAAMGMGAQVVGGKHKPAAVASPPAAVPPPATAAAPPAAPPPAAATPPLTTPPQPTTLGAMVAARPAGTRGTSTADVLGAPHPNIDPTTGAIVKTAGDVIREDLQPGGGPLATAVNAGIETAAQQIDAIAPPPILDAPHAPRPVDADTIGRIRDLPPEQQDEALGQLNLANRMDVQAGVRRHAQGRLDAMLGTQVPTQEAPGRPVSETGDTAPVAKVPEVAPPKPGDERDIALATAQSALTEGEASSAFDQREADRPKPKKKGTIEPGDIRASHGDPFVTRAAVMRTLHQNPGATIVPVEGGFVVRPPKEPKNELGQPAVTSRDGGAETAAAAPDPGSKRADRGSAAQGGESANVAGSVQRPEPALPAGKPGPAKVDAPLTTKPQPTTLGAKVDARPAGTRGTSAADVVKQAPEPAAALEVAPEEAPVADVAAPKGEAEPIVEHTTSKGKTLRGVVRNIPLADAKAIDPFTFKKDGGYFLREARVQSAPQAGETVTREAHNLEKSGATPEPASRPEEAAAKPADKLKPVSAADKRELRKRGEQVASIMDAERRFSDGERIFLAHEQGGVSEATSVLSIQNGTYTADQMTALPAVAPAPKPVTPQIPNDEGTKYVLPSFVTTPHMKAGVQPAAEPERPAPKVSANTIVTDEAAEKAREILRSKLGINTGKRGQAGGLDPDVLHAGITLALYHVEKGARTFSAFARAMVDDMGDAIKPYLKSFYMAVKYDPRASELAATMSPAGEVESADVDAVSLPEKADTTGDGGALPANEVPGVDTVGPRDDAAVGDGDRKPLDDGLAGQGESPDRSGAVPTRPADAGGTGAPGVQPAGERPPGTSRDSAGVRPDGRPAEPVAADFDLVGEDIGKGGLTKKYRDNIAAIRILKAMDAEDRVATPAERKAIARYVGWGSMKGAFDPESRTWAKEHAEVRDLLTLAEWKGAAASTLNAHYTSPVVVTSMFDALQRLGVTRGRMLEPSVGVGNFFGLMPAEMRKASSLYGVELDPLTSKIVAALYPSAKIKKATGFEDYDVPSEYFDVAFGNPPFGSEPIVDMERSPYSGFSVHNYFLAKAIDKLRPGGVMSMVVSHYFLDAQDDRARQWIGERAALIGAVRLPNTAFKDNAGTEVVTDILVFQKRDKVNGLPSDMAAWRKTGTQRNTHPKTGEGFDHTVNELFISKPDLVLGTPTASGTMYAAGQYNVEPSGDLDAQLKAWTQTLPENVYTPIERDTADEAADVEIPDGVKVGSFFVGPDGVVRHRGRDVMGRRRAGPWTPPNDKAIERMKGMVGLRDGLRTQMRLERSTDATEKEIEAGRKKLNKLYDAFHKDHGFINDPANRRLFLDDTESSLMQALEFDYDRGVSKAVADRESIEPRAPSATKADILSRRVLFPPGDDFKVTSAKDALLASLNYKGRVDLKYMATLYGAKPDAIVAELGDVLFNDPQAGLVTADEYLSGDVKTKLAEAEAAVRDDDSKLARNVEALRKIIPADKKPSEIHASLGAPFIPAEMLTAFAMHVSGSKAKAHYIKATGQWMMEFVGADPALNRGKYGTADMLATDILAATVAGKTVIVKVIVRNGDGSTTTVVKEKETEAAREKQNAVKAEWQTWLWKDEERADSLVKIYNDKMNRTVDRKFDGQHMTFPGMSPAMKLLDHQKNGVWRGLQSYQVLYDHVVGAGKTYQMATLAMEMRRLGIARKPFFAVPNHLTLQWRSEFARLYPSANVLAATPDDFAKGNRERFFSKITTGDWDAVIVGHSSMKKIGLPPETEKKVLQEQIDQLAAGIEEMKRARGDRNIVGAMEKIKKTLEAKLKDKLAALGKRDKVLTFDELGIDAMFVDEVHEFKNLYFNSTMERVPGMGNPAGSNKAFDLFVKLQWMRETFGEKAPIITATGTPVSNSLVEMFNVQRLMQYDSMKRQNVNVFDAWAKTFGSVETLYEVASSGTGYRNSARFSKFKNLPALMSQYVSFADVITLDDLKAQEEALGKKYPVPKIAGGRPQIVVADRSPAVANFMGVPSLQLGENGKPNFVINFETQTPEIIEGKNAQSGEPEFEVRIKRGENDKYQQSLGKFKTQADANMKVVESAVTPQITVDPNSILGQFANLKQIVRRTKGKVNALSLTGQANKAGLDYRLIDPGAPDFPGSKINLAVDNIVATYKKWASDKGAQLVFCDLSVPLSARSGFESKARRVYVLQDGMLAHKQGTMHVVEGFESIPFYVVAKGAKDDKGDKGDKDAKTSEVYDAVSGRLARPGFPTRAAAIEWAGVQLRDTESRQQWIEDNEATGEIAQEDVDDYDSTNEIDTEETESITRQDIAGLSGPTKFSVYDDIHAKLRKKGIPDREIAFIHDYGTPTAKAKLFAAVKSGAVRVLLGSTPKMGAGTNVQDRLVGLHHIDAPWRPSDLEQREGRIIRRGNLLYQRDPDGFEVSIFRYATQQTYDTRRWQILEHKARGIEQLRNYDGSMNEIDDIEGEAANAADMKAAASGDPLILKETQLRNDTRRLENLQDAHVDEVQSMLRKARVYQAWIDRDAPKEIANWNRLIERANQNAPAKEGELSFEVNGQRYTERKAAVAAIEKVIHAQMIGERSHDVFTFRGLDFSLSKRDGFQSSAIVLASPTGELDAVVIGQGVMSPSGTLQRFANYIDRMPAHIAAVNAQIVERTKNVADFRAQAQLPFAQTELLTQTRAEYLWVQRLLIAKGPPIPDKQKPVLARAVKEQLRALREGGYGEAVDEFLAFQGATKSADEAITKDASTNPAQTGSEAANATDVVFSRGASPAAGQRVAAVEALAARITAAWPNAPRVIVLDSLEDGRVPVGLLRAVRAEEAGGATGTVRGTFAQTQGGPTVYLFADALPDQTAITQTLMHETLGHYGLRGTFGEGLGAILDRIAVLNPEKVRAKAKEYGKNLSVLEQRRVAAEELLAEMAQKNNPELGWVRRAIAAIRTWLRENLPGYKSMMLSDDEIVRNYLLPARAFVERARTGEAPTGAVAQPAFARAFEKEGGGPTDSADASNIVFSRSTGPRSVAGVLNDAADARLPMGYVLGDLYKTGAGKLSWWHRSIGTQFNLAEKQPLFRPVFDSVQRFLSDTSRYANEQADMAPTILPKLESFKSVLPEFLGGKAAVSAEDAKGYSRPVFEGTLSWVRDERGQPVRIEDRQKAADVLTSEQKAMALFKAGKVSEAELKRWQATPLDIYDGAVRNRYEAEYLKAGMIWTDDELRSMFKATPAQIKLYKEFRAATDRSISDMATSEMLKLAGKDIPAAMVEQMMRLRNHDQAAIALRDHLWAAAETDLVRAKVLNAAADLIVKLADRANVLQKRGYAPLSRHGQYSLDVVAAGERVYFGLFESTIERAKRLREMQANYPGATITEGTVSQHEHELLQGINPDTAELFGDILGLDSTGNEAKDLAFQQYIKNATATRSAMRRLIHRKGIAGFSEDAGRVLAGFVVSNARQTSSNLNMGTLNKAVAAIPKEQGQLKDAAVKLAAYIKNPQEEAQAIRGLLFAQYLGGSVASALVNATQPFVITMPWLSQFGGAAAAGRQMAAATRDQFKTLTGDKGLDAALHDATESGILAPHELHQMMSQASGKGALRVGDGTTLGNAVATGQNALAKTVLAWGKVFSLAESFNRRTTFIAAYRTAVAQKMSDPAAFAHRAVVETQFVYNKGNRPAWARGAIGSTLFTFKQYTISYLELLGRMWNNGKPGSAERANSRKAVLFAMLALFLVGGADGLPFEGNIEDLLDGFMQRLGYNFSSKRAKHEFFARLLGEAGARIVDKGFSGLPGVPMDVSGRMGAGKPLPGTGLLLKKTDHTSDVTEMAGPVADLAKRGFEALGKVVDGDLGGAATVMQATAVRNIFKGIDMLRTGGYRDGKDNKVVDTSMAEAVLKMLGFQPNSVARIQEAAHEVVQMTALTRLVQHELTGKLARAIYDNDSEAKQEVRMLRDRWNAANPDTRIKVDMPAALKRVKEMRSTKAERIEKASPKARRAQVREMLAEAQ